MALILVTYDLSRGSREDYDDLYAELKKGGGWWHYLESTWILSTEETSEQVADRLREHLGKGDRLIVVRIDGQDRQGWLPKPAWDWIRRHE